MRIEFLEAFGPRLKGRGVARFLSMLGTCFLGGVTKWAKTFFISRGLGIRLLTSAATRFMVPVHARSGRRLPMNLGLKCGLLSVALGAAGATPAGPVATKTKPLDFWTPSDQKVVLYDRAHAPSAPKIEELALKQGVSQYGITWTFDRPVRVGQFVNGDWYVVGPTTVTAISPKPIYGSEIPETELDERDKNHPVEQRVRNGFMLNPPARMKVAYDSGVRNYFDPSLIQKLPVALKAGDSLVSTISMAKGLVLKPQLWESVERGVDDSSPIRTAAILTCVASPLPADAFRSAFCDRQARLYFSHDLKRELLPTLAAPKNTPNIGLYVRFTQRPWVATCFFGFEEPVENMPQYGRDYARVVGLDALLLCTNFEAEEKETLLVDFVQVGIDLGGMIRAGHPGWEGFGGHGPDQRLCR